MWLALLSAIFLLYFSIVKKRKPSIKRLKRKNKRRLSTKLHEVLSVLKLVEDKKKEIKTVSEQSQDELEPINSPMSDE